ncbi:AEC family transporter [Haloimpatiens sp. FM7315]|uniref:AEC family transporter n=1 Tax=Haloimpatiens sp. FM7315 TaxID=3298609 RepID=UPI00370BC0D1
MENNSVINQVIILFIIIILGYYSRKRGILNKEINKGLSNLLLRVTLPFMIIASFNYKFSPELLHNIKKIFIYSLIIHMVLIPLSKVFYYKYPKDNDKKDILRFITVFSNSGFMGYPVLGSLYGKVGILYASIFNIPFNILSWTFGLMLFTKSDNSKNIKKIITNPGIISVFIGIFFFTFSIKLPYVIQNSLELVGSITVPISMIIIGSMLAEVKIKEVFREKSIYYVSFVRLFLIPAITYIILSLIKADKLLINIAVIVEAMPAAAICSIFAESYDKNPEFASKGVFITTLLSVITIPIVILFLK